VIDPPPSRSFTGNVCARVEGGSFEPVFGSFEPSRRPNFLATVSLLTPVSFPPAAKTLSSGLPDPRGGPPLRQEWFPMKLRIALFILIVAAIASFGLFTP
jgi:hypothetical protein